MHYAAVAEIVRTVTVVDNARSIIWFPRAVTHSTEINEAQLASRNYVRVVNVIVDRVVPERFSYRNSDNERENETALLKVEVNLDENNNTDKIIIYPGDDAKEKTLQFCLKHRLNEEKKNTLLRIIMEKIEDNKKGEKINFEGRKTEQNQIFQETKKTESEKDTNTNVKKETEN